MQINFSKMQGLGNDFIVINNMRRKHNLTSAQISFLADRKFGIGCDQLLIIEPSTDGISDFFYKIYNSDGSEVGQCGNGARCFIKYVIDHNLTRKQQIKLQTNTSKIVGEQIGENLYSIDMGIPNFTPQNIPLETTKSAVYSTKIDNRVINFYALSMGNPHAVIILDNSELLNNDAYLEAIAKHLQQSALFPNSVNVNFISVKDKDNIALRTCERGCGFTLACGSGACASAAVSILNNLTNATTTVHMRGGELQIKWDKERSLYMIGSATQVFNGTIEI